MKLGCTSQQMNQLPPSITQQNHVRNMAGYRYGETVWCAMHYRRPADASGLSLVVRFRSKALLILRLS